MRALAESLGNRTPDRDRLREEIRAASRGTSADLNLDARAIDFRWKDLRVFRFAPFRPALTAPTMIKGKPSKILCASDFRPRPASFP